MISIFSLVRLNLKFFNAVLSLFCLDFEVMSTLFSFMCLLFGLNSRSIGNLSLVLCFFFDELCLFCEKLHVFLELGVLCVVFLFIIASGGNFSCHIVIVLVHIFFMIIHAVRALMLALLLVLLLELVLLLVSNGFMLQHLFFYHGLSLLHWHWLG